MLKLINFLFKVFVLIIGGLYLFNEVLPEYVEKKNTKATPKSSEVKVEIPSPPMAPAPKIEPPTQDTREEAPSMIDRVLAYIERPCHPAMESFVAAHRVQPLRARVMEAIPKEHHAPLDLAQICDVFDHLQNNWKWARVPQDYFEVADAVQSWETRQGSHYDYACAMSAALHALGAETRVTFGHNHKNGWHTFTEVCLGNLDDPTLAVKYIIGRYKLPANTRIYTRQDALGNVFLNLDWSARHPGCAYFPTESGAQLDMTNNNCEKF